MPPEYAARRPRGAPRIYLIGLAAALLLIGLVSGTFWRHVVQILPIALAVVVMRSRPAWAAWAAMPIFVFWIAIVMLIWLFLLGLSQFANGHYTAIEIVLTVVMAACSVGGVITSVLLGRSLPLTGRVAAFTVFAVLQLCAMWASFTSAIANR
jgi:hypothetical protein